MLVALHADDLGFSASINGGIADGLRNGLLTGASLLANAPAAGEALLAWRRIEEDRKAGSLPAQQVRRMLGDPARPFDLGVHLNLSQGRPLTGDAFPPALLDRDGYFAGVSTFVRLMLPHARRHADAVRREVAAQTEFILDHGLRPVRFDGHQYSELVPLVNGVVRELADIHGIRAIRIAREPGVIGTLLRNRGLCGAAGIPAALAKRMLADASRRSADHSGLRHAACFFGSVTAGRISLHDLDRFLGLAVRRRTAVAEVGLHPGLPQPDHQAAQDGAWRDPLAEVRPREHAWLTGQELPRVLQRWDAKLGRLA